MGKWPGPRAGRWWPVNSARPMPRCSARRGTADPAGVELLLDPDGSQFSGSSHHLSPDETSNPLAPAGARYDLQPGRSAGLKYHPGLVHVVRLPLYLSGVWCTIVNDTIYAHKDKVNDALLTIKPIAIRFGDQTKLWLYGFYTAVIGGLVTADMVCEQT